MSTFNPHPHHHSTLMRITLEERMLVRWAARLTDEDLDYEIIQADGAHAECQLRGRSHAELDRAWVKWCTLLREQVERQLERLELAAAGPPSPKSDGGLPASLREPTPPPVCQPVACALADSIRVSVQRRAPHRRASSPAP